MNIKYQDRKIKCSGFNRLLLIVLWLTSSTLIPLFASAGVNISGVIKDVRTGQGISAARVSVSNEPVSAITDEDGSFSIRTSSASSLLVVSAIGYTPREIGVRGRTSIEIVLFPEGFTPVLNSTAVKSLLASEVPDNVVKVSADEIIPQLFGGKLRAANRSGAIGTGYSLFIRGLNSLNQNAQPLFVIDGVIRDNLYDVQSIHAGFFSNPLANIEFNDIEDIQVIKDGTSLYGAKGANGVIVITTRRARDMVTRINLNLSTGITAEPRTIPVMGADDYRIFVSEILGTAGLTNDEVLQLPFLNDDPKRSTYKRYHNQTNWNDYIYRTGLQNNYAINVTGGDDKARYYFSLGFTNNQGVVIQNDFQRYNMRLNADLKLTPKISSAINIGFSRIDRNLIDDGVEPNTSPTWMSLIKAPFLSPYNYTFMGDLTTEFAFADIFNVGNPPAVINHSINTVKQNGFNISLKPKVLINNELNVTAHFDYYLNKTNEDYYRPYLYAAPVFIHGIGDSYNARMSQVMRSNVLFADARLNYSKKLDARSSVDAFAGTRIIYNEYESDYVEGHNSRSNSSVNLRGSFRNLVSDGVNLETKSISHYLNAVYQYDQRYFLNAVFSMDASSRFGRQTESGIKILGHSWALFPAVNAAWLASSEEFMQQMDFISLLKLKTGYSISGNDDIPAYQSRTYFGSEKLQGVASGLVLKQLANPKIQWETTSRANVGIDLGLFNDRINLAVDAFQSVTNNLLVLKDLPEVSGLAKYWSNEGQMKNRGLEATIGARIISTTNLQWEAALSVGRYRNQITQLPAGEFITTIYGAEVLSRVGQPAGVFYGYKTLGVFTDEQQAADAGLTMRNEFGELVSFGAGDIIFADVHNAMGVRDGIIDSNDRQIIGDPNPDWYGSFNQSLRYKKLTVNALFTFSVGNDIYNHSRHMLESQSDLSNQSLAVLARWRADGQTTNQPRAVYGDPMGNARFSDRWIEDGSYLRLKSLSVAYQVPLKSDFLQGFSVWVSAENLWTLTGYLGADPDVSVNNRVLYQGIDAGLLPLSRSYNIGLRLNL